MNTSTSALRIHTKKWERGIIRLDLQGYLGAETMNTLEAELSEWFRKEHYSFAVGMSEVRSMTSAGAALFISLVHLAQQHGGEILLVNPSEAAKQSLRTFKVLHLFHVVSSLEEVR